VRLVHIQPTGPTPGHFVCSDDPRQPGRQLAPLCRQDALSHLPEAVAGRFYCVSLYIHLYRSGRRDWLAILCPAQITENIYTLCYQSDPGFDLGCLAPAIILDRQYHSKSITI